MSHDQYFIPKPMLSDFWCAELFIAVPRVSALPLRTIDDQRLFDLWHGLEDGIECWPRPVQVWRLKWMKRIELTFEQFS